LVNHKTKCKETFKEISHNMLDHTNIKKKINIQINSIDYVINSTFWNIF